MGFVVFWTDPWVGTENKSSDSSEDEVHNVIRKSQSPLIVNEDILREALRVAEHFEVSEDSEFPSPLSSDQKTSSEGSESDASKRFLRYRPSRTVVEARVVETASSSRSGTAKLTSSSSITTPRQRQSSHIFTDVPASKIALHSSRSRSEDRVQSLMKNE